MERPWSPESRGGGAARARRVDGGRRGRARRALALALGAALSACGAGEGGTDAAPEPWVRSAPPPEGAGERVRRVRAEEEPALRASAAPGVLRPGWDRLVLTAEDGTRRVLADEVVQGELRSLHRFVGSMDPLPLWVVERQYVPEGRAVLAVDRRTGEVTELDDVPAPSPDGKRFATASAGLVAGHSPNRVRVYRMEAGGPLVEWEGAAVEWGARNPVWEGPDGLRVERVMVDWTTYEALSAPLRLRRVSGGWAAEPSAEHARQTLRSFLSALDRGHFVEASLLFGGPYARLRAWSPGVSAEDRPALWREACARGALRCSGGAEVVRAESASADEVRIEVRHGDGAAAFTLRRDGDGWRVMDLPPATP